MKQEVARGHCKLYQFFPLPEAKLFPQLEISATLQTKGERVTCVSNNMENIYALINTGLKGKARKGYLKACEYHWACL